MLPLARRKKCRLQICRNEPDPVETVGDVVTCGLSATTIETQELRNPLVPFVLPVSGLPRERNEAAAISITAIASGVTMLLETLQGVQRAHSGAYLTDFSDFNQ